jgi:glucokinase
MTTGPAPPRHDQPLLAIDIGGTKLAAVVVVDDTFASGSLSVPTPRDDPTALWTALTGLVDAALGAARDAGVTGALAGVGIGCGGPMDLGSQRVSPLNIPAWQDFPLAQHIAAHVDAPTWLDNDAKALALAEGWRGAACGERNFLAMVVSTGVGGGVVVDGRLLDGETGNAGHVGHIIVEPDGRTCGCGARGCLEAEASGTAIAAITGRPAKEADTAVRQRTGRLVGRAVASVANLLDCRLAAVAGSVALGFGDVFFAAANQELAERARLSFSTGARIVPAGLGSDGPLLGAAAVARRQLGWTLD